MAGDRLAVAKAGARALLGELRPADQAMVVAIGGAVDTVAPLSVDRAGQAAAVDGLDPWSTTALHDAVIAAIDRVQEGSGRRALVLFSDSTTGTAAPVRAPFSTTRAAPMSWSIQSVWAARDPLCSRSWPS